MRKTLLLAVLLLVVACGAYRFPGQPSGSTGALSGQVTTVGCGMVGPAVKTMCVPPPVPLPAVCVPDASPGVSCSPKPAPGVTCPPDASGSNSCWRIHCPLAGPAANTCGPLPVPGLELDFINGGTTLSTKTDSNGTYSIELPVGTWTVSPKNYMRIVSGPTMVTITAGASIVANYTVWSSIAYSS